MRISACKRFADYKVTDVKHRAKPETIWKEIVKETSKVSI